MITVDEALALVAQHAAPLAARDVSLNAVLGLRLAEPIASDVDSPPFDKSLLDGYAVSLGDARATLRVIEQVVAGDVPHHAVSPGLTIRVMTGAPLPEGADAVVKLEDCTLNGDEVQLPREPPVAGAGVMRCGESFRQGEQVLAAEKTLGPLDVALLAEIGRGSVAAIPRPRVAVLPTGDELVECDQPLAPGQIRNSNGPMLLAALASAGYEALDLGVARDVAHDLSERIASGLDADVLLLTGGVSAGVMDLVPDTLAELGVREVFHKVRLKPGKPVWFGVAEAQGSQAAKLIYGLPGNPVSALVAYRLFVTPALERLAGGPFTPSETFRGVLTTAAAHRGKRPTYHPCRFARPASGGELPQVQPLRWRGSADLRALTEANGLAVLPAGDYEYAAGTEVGVLPL